MKLLALYMAGESLGTACNVTCDGAIAVLIDDSATQAQEARP